MIQKLVDFPKIESPFVREEINGAYVVTPKIAEGMEWVFYDSKTIATEKIHGTCCAIVIENGIVSAMFNRTNRIPFIGGTLSKAMTVGVNNALEKNRFVLQDGIHWGELIGPRIQKNEYNLIENEWLPFDWIKEHLAYTSWGKYPKTFDSICNTWFKTLMPLYAYRVHGKEAVDKDPKLGFVEGVVFHHPDGRKAKLRLDMMPWFSGLRHKEVDVL